MYRFFISYAVSNGFGNMIVESKYPDISRSFIREWEEVIGSKYASGYCCILNIIPISSNEY